MSISHFLNPVACPPPYPPNPNPYPVGIFLTFPNGDNHLRAMPTEVRHLWAKKGCFGLRFGIAV